MIKIITIDREYGSGAADIAATLAAWLGWKLWDELLTIEIARVVVGRGSAYYLQSNPDAFHLLIYAPFEKTIQRLCDMGRSEEEAHLLAETVDQDRAAYIKQYFKIEWPFREVYQLMINSSLGDDVVVETILNSVGIVDRSLARR